MLKTPPSSYTGLVVSLCTTSLAATACFVGAGGLGFSPVDEDWDRASPNHAADGALIRSCEESPPEEPNETPDELFAKEQAFERALCLCGSLEEVGSGLVTRSRSGLAGDDPGRAAVGINGSMEIVGHFDIDGSLDVAGGLDGVGNLDVGRDLISGEGVDVVGNWNVGQDAWVDGDINGVGSMDIGNDLYLTGDLDAIGNVKYNLGHRGFQYRDAPCGCSPSEIIDVEAEVAKRRTNNDNDLIAGGIGSSNIVLGDGEYYFANAGELVGSRNITVEGRAAIYVEGDIETVGDLSIDVAPRGELELWVAGTVKTVGNLTFAAADARRPRAFRLLMGGAGKSIMNVGNATFVGSVYAPQVDIEYVGSLTVDGSLFANNLQGTGSLRVNYDTDVAAPPTCVDEHYQLME